MVQASIGGACVSKATRNRNRKQDHKRALARKEAAAEAKARRLKGFRPVTDPGEVLAATQRPHGR